MYINKDYYPNIRSLQKIRNKRYKKIKTYNYLSKTKTENNSLSKSISGRIVLISLIIFGYIYLNLYKRNKKDKNTILEEKLNTLSLVFNNNENIYKGMKNCLLNNPDEQLCIYHLIAPKKVIGKNRILLGTKSDGCYVLLDDFKDIKIAYSFGIANMIQFDTELANRGIDVYMYDHTINGLPYQNPRFHWKKIGIRGKNEVNSNLKTLEDLIQENGHTKEKNMIFKIDTEGAEWNSINDLPEIILTQFKYIVIEYHFINLNEGQLYYNVIKKISKTHQAFYLRCQGRENIITFGNNRICQFLEVSYIIKVNNNFDKDDVMYPIFKFDFSGPNNSEKVEFNINLLKLFTD